MPKAHELIGLLGEAQQQELRWHLALMVPRLRLNAKERLRVAAALRDYLQDRSSIVKTHAMQGLSDLSQQGRELRPMVMEMIRDLTRTGTPAMRARGRKLLRKLESPGLR